MSTSPAPTPQPGVSKVRDKERLYRRVVLVCAGFVGFVGVGLLICGYVVQVKGKEFVKSEILKDMVLEEGTMLFESWKKPPPLTLQFYFYNWTNAEQYHNWTKTGTLPAGTKPILKQIGPYTFSEKRRKDYIYKYMSPNNDTIYYREMRTFIFDAKRSCPSCQSDQDYVTLVNVPLMAAAGVAAKKGSMYTTMLQSLIIDDLPDKENLTIYMRTSVRDIAFTGYRDSLTTKIDTLHSNDAMPNGAFAIFYNNGTFCKEETSVYRGNLNHKKVGTTDTWNHKRNLTLWAATNNSRCNDINGTDGMMFGPDLSRSDRLYMFRADLFRSAYADYDSDVTVHGIPAFRYSYNQSLLSYGPSFPDNWCFCSDGVCPEDGLFDMSPTKSGAPILASLANCYLCDRTLVQQVEGMNPIPDQHESYIVVEPNTGLSLEAATRVQVNVRTKAYKEIPLLRNMTALVFPVLWVNESFKLNEKMAVKFKSNLLKPLSISQYLPCIFYGVGGILIIIAILICKCCRNNR